ncbi:unnamed protein product [Heligmosomoides polygyrus]|uniref:DOMON domain-containing protein n=1 Tax=Heligmosomoides polygyrus TaxID=6339 RepID=A0A3P8B7T7_HELPZ|nr:unnamed protein product [Heligmosomoides polygyrus]
MTLFVSLKRGGTIEVFWHATGTNGGAAGARSSKSMINGTTGDTGGTSVVMDYISIPQNNPDLDYMQAAAFPNSLYAKCTNSSTTEYNVMCGRYEQSYGSFASGVSTPGALSDMYITSTEKTQGLETLPEIETPKTSTYNFMQSPERIRPPSRASTHV